MASSRWLANDIDFGNALSKQQLAPRGAEGAKSLRLSAELNIVEFCGTKKIKIFIFFGLAAEAASTALLNNGIGHSVIF